MIHSVKLPQETLTVLTVITQVQLALLAYADQCLGALDQSTCETFLTQRLAHQVQLPGSSITSVSGLARSAAAWAFRGSSNRKALLESFRGPHQGTRSKVIQAMQRDADMLLTKRPHGRLTRFAVPADTHPDFPWMNTFLLSCYNGLTSAGGLSGELLGRADRYQRQEFLKAFRSSNREQWVCIVCDEQTWCTHDSDAVRADIDHYFPKKLYPHLCVHPFNLIPTCHLCNSSVKGDLDPLDYAGSLKELELPYRPRRGLREDAYLRYNFSSAPPGGLITIHARMSPKRLVPWSQRGWPKPVVNRRIAAFQRLSNLPDRWNKRGVADITPNTWLPGTGLEHHLFLRTLAYLRSARWQAPLTPMALLALLEEYIGYLNKHECGRFPDTYPLLWWLQAHVKDLRDRITRGTALQFPLLVTINQCYSQMTIESSIYRNDAREMGWHLF
jgi:hypothetical protein